MDILGTKKFSVATAHTASATATQAAPGASKRLFVTDVAGSSDHAGAILKVIEDTAGTPVIKFELEIGATNPFSHRFRTPIQITANKTASVWVNGTATAKAFIAGYITSH